ncbi:vacuolar-processing enzyme-like protein, partial [Tanacetum coccineum]
LCFKGILALTLKEITNLIEYPGKNIAGKNDPTYKVKYIGSTSCFVPMHLYEFVPMRIYVGLPRSQKGSSQRLEHNFDDLDVKPKYFLAVLTWDEKVVGGKKVVKSTAKDHVFVYYVGHGGKEILDMPTVELEKSHILATLARMEQQER